MKDYIILRRSSIAITNYKSVPFEKLSNILVKLTKFDTPPHPKAPKPCTYKGFLSETKKFKGEEVDLLYLPFNFSLEKITECFPNHEVVNVTKPVEAISYNDLELKTEFDYRDEEQREIADFLHRRNNHKNTPFYGVDLIQASTAVGKSYSYIRYWVESGAKRLMGVFASQTHLDNFKTELLKFTNLTEDEIFSVNGQSSFKRIKDTHKVILCINMTIASSVSDVLEYENDENETSFRAIPHISEKPLVIKLIEDLQIGDIVIDEVHLGLNALTQLLALVNVNAITQLTATPNRSDYQEDRIFKYLTPEVFLAIEKEARLEVMSYSYEIPFSEYEIMKCSSTRGFNNSIYHNIIEEKYFDEWYEKISLLLAGLYENNGDTIGSIGIVVAAPLSFISNLKIRLQAEYPDKSIGDYTSNIAKSKRGAELDKDIVVTTEKSFNGSVNPLRMNYMIFHGCLRSPVIIEQISGRLRGDNTDCVFIDVFNRSIPAVVKFWKYRQKTFKNIAKVIYEEEKIM